ncbi:MAG: TonB-dependent receptor [Acidobacteria bacterium]|nr:TonB-dependent receptor [Acidobacteriota bacterium]
MRKRTLPGSSRKRMSIGRFMLALLCAVAACAVIARAQQDSATLAGAVTDGQGGAVAGATVTAVNTDTGAARRMKTSAAGNYLFTQLAPGHYTVRVEADGFKAGVWRDVRLTVRTPVTLDLRLSVGEITETVTVSDNPSRINTRDATIGNDFAGRQITQLPLEGRNVLALLSLQPGVVYTSDTNTIFRTNFGEADADPRNGAVNGGRGDQANITLDGVDINDQQTGFAFQGALRVGVESVQEFRIVTAGANADSGRSSGAQVALVTRGGTNEFRGALFHSHRNTATSANSFFNNRAGLPRAKLLRNVFGGALGGPIRENRLFFFGSYEGRRDASEATVIRNVPTQLFRDGFIRYRNRSGQIATLTPDQVRQLDPLGIGVNPRIRDVMRLFPLPNDTPNIDPLNFGGYRFNSPVREGLNAATLRLDWNAAPSHQFFLRGNLQTDEGATALQFPNTPPPQRSRNTSKGFAAGHNWAINAGLANAFRYGYTFNKVEEIGTTTGPLFSFGGGIGAPVPLTYSRGRIAPTHNFVNDLSLNRGSHQWQFGGNIRLLANDRYNVEPNRALYVTQVSRLANRGIEVIPSDLATGTNDDFVRAAIILLGVVSQGNTPVNYDQTGKLIPPGTPLRRNFVTREYEGYAQDQWRLRSNLTLTLGLRYALFSPLRERDGLSVRPNIPVGEWFRLRGEAAEAGRPSTSVAPIAYVLDKQSGAKGFYDWDRNNFAPRLAAAWTPRVGWSVRAGFGIHYDRVGSASAALYDSLGSFGLNSTQINPAGGVTVATAPRFVSLDAMYPSLAQPTPPFSFPLQYPRATQGLVGAIIPAPDTSLRTPYSYLSNLSVQKEFGSNWVAEAAYVNRTSRNLLTLFDSAAPLNLRDPQSGLTYYEAVGQLAAQTSLTGARPVAYFDNLFPGLATTAQNLTRSFSAFTRLNPGVAPDTPLSPTQTAYFLFQQLNPGNALAALRSIDVTCAPSCSRLGRYAFYNDQFASLFSWRSIAPASYHALQLTLRRRFADDLQLDANYTLSRARDWTSGVERGDAFAGSFLINSWVPDQMEAPSEFDLRHQFNLNWIAELPFGRGRRFGAKLPAAVNAIVGGWQLAGIMRLSSGFPVSVQNGVGNPTNHYFRGFGKLTGAEPETGTNKNAPQGPNLFADPAAAASAFSAPNAGETGDRNSLRGDGLFSLDFGLSKQWAMPRRESGNIAFRWEVFNATNSVRFNTRSLNLTVGQAGFGTYSTQLVNPRVMQFLLRVQF